MKWKKFNSEKSFSPHLFVSCHSVRTLYCPTQGNSSIEMWYSSITNGRKSFSRKGSNDDIKAKRSDDDDDFAMGERSTCQENLHQYLLNSTLHGLRYVGERHISPFERFDAGADIMYRH